MYVLTYHPRVKKFLKKLSLAERQNVGNKLRLLAENPFSDAIDVKKLSTSFSAYRLRVGTIRIVYVINTTERILYVHDMDFRGNIY